MIIFFIHRTLYSQLPSNFIDEGKNLKLVDAPVSGGVKRASEGTLTVRTSKFY